VEIIRAPPFDPISGQKKAALLKGGFFVYLSTFIIGLLLANYIILAVVNFFAEYTQFNEAIATIAGKFLSIVLPYFVLYYLRKFLFSLLHKHKLTKQSN
jgi:uncharacterized membrane protein YqjE